MSEPHSLNLTEESLGDLELGLEDEALAIARGRARKEHEGSLKRGEWSDSFFGKVFVNSAHRRFVGAVEAFMHQPKNLGRAHNRAAKMLVETGLEPEMISYLFVKSAFNVLPLARETSLKRITFCIRSVDAIHTEWRVRVFQEIPARRALLAKLKKDMDGRTYPKHWRLKTLRTYFDAEKVEWQGWSHREKLLIGYALMVLFRDSTGLIACGKNDTYVQPAPELLTAITDAVEKNVLAFTLYQPMVKQPRPWSADRNLFKGGYLGRGNVRPYPIIKGARKRDAERMMAMDWSAILPAINALQETPWRVNSTMVEALDWVFNEIGNGACDLPMPEAKELPPTPWNYATDEEAKKAHNRACFEVHDANRQMIAKRLSVLYTLSLGRKFAQFPRIYFPHNLDERGRAYPLPAFLNPQGPDYAKGMLEFAHGEPIENDDQAAWLAIVGANAWGNDKVSLQERADWVVENTDWIVECGTDFRANTRWMEAGDPFQFLRFCIEWAGYENACAHGGVFYSTLPCPVDATNSGLQHYSAMLRDEAGGRLVNLVPGLDRQDIYGEVAKVTLRMLGEHVDSELDFSQENALRDWEWAKDWLDFGIDRKMTKRQVMVVPYAGKFTSCMEYTRKGFKEKIKGGQPRRWPKEQDFERCNFLAKFIWAAISEVVVEGRKAMAWLSKVANLWSSHWNEIETETGYDRRLTWKTPDGFEVVQWRDQSKRGRIESYMEGRVQLVIFEEGELLDGRDMALSTPPNFVHSLDATHLRMSVMKALDLGITSFAMVHDSFGVHARHLPAFVAQAVKPAFIAMYSEHDPLAELRASLPFNCEHPPEKGNLDLAGIADSEFFFS